MYVQCMCMCVCMYVYVYISHIYNIINMKHFNIIVQFIPNGHLLELTPIHIYYFFCHIVHTSPNNY